MSITDFKELAEGIQAVVLTLAVIVGGFWALYRFWSLQEIHKAKAELSSLQKTLAERGTLTFELTANCIPRSNENGFYINTKAIVVNVGNRTEILNWQEGYVETARVVGEKDGDIIFGDWSETKLIGRELRLDATIAPSEKREYSFLVPVIDPGVYYVCIKVNGSPEETEATRKYLGGSADDTILWTADTYLVVS